MARHIGIAACSSEGAALCYRTICLEAHPVMGEHDHPEITLSSIPMARHIPFFDSGDRRGLADLLLVSARKLAEAGAAFAVCPDNTCHLAMDLVRAESPIPFLHITEEVANEAERHGFRRLALLGTRVTMEGPVYRSVLAARGIAWEVPDAGCWRASEE